MRFTWIKWPLISQGIVVSGLWLVGVYLLFPSAILPAAYVQIMHRAANGYSVMHWADSVLPKDAVMLSTHRSVGLSPRAVVASDWMGYIDLYSQNAISYLERLKDQHVNYVLLTGNENNFLLKVCLGKKVAGPYYSHLATRNPFNQGPATPNWIYALDSKRLPACVKNNRVS